MANFGTILCVINLTEHNDDILQYAKDFADKDSKIIVAHPIINMSSIQSYILSDSMIDDIVKKAKIKTIEYLDNVTNKELKGFNVEKLLIEDRIAKEVERLIDEKCADLVIMGSMSTKGFTGFFSTKDASNLVGNLRIPILVVPNDLSLECLPQD